tara:strand:- start:1058 stop:1198 length:141 start_codon:yes stop_codon:yes gene_type:complete
VPYLISFLKKYNKVLVIYLTLFYIVRYSIEHNIEVLMREQVWELKI